MLLELLAEALELCPANRAVTYEFAPGYPDDEVDADLTRIEGIVAAVTTDAVEASA